MAFGRGRMRHRMAGMSPHMGVGQETTGFARGLHQTHPVGLGNPATLQAPLAGPLGNNW
jgi:hypothetical protein